MSRNPVSKVLLTWVWQVASNVFGLSHAMLHCSESTTLDDFSNGVLVASQTPAEERITRFESEAEKVF